jgi:hypothetical protein
MNDKINIKRPGQILDYVDTKEHLVDLFNYITNLQSNWNSLREWVQKHYDEYKDMEQDAMFEFSLMLDKMNELEGVDNESNRYFK